MCIAIMRVGPGGVLTHHHSTHPSLSLFGGYLWPLATSMIIRCLLAYVNTSKNTFLALALINLSYGVPPSKGAELIYAFFT